MTVPRGNRIFDLQPHSGREFMDTGPSLQREGGFLTPFSGSSSGSLGHTSIPKEGVGESGVQLLTRSEDIRFAGFCTLSFDAPLWSADDFMFKNLMVQISRDHTWWRGGWENGSSVENYGISRLQNRQNKRPTERIRARPPHPEFTHPVYSPSPLIQCLRE
ncbi:hypothetical protein B9Z19DRAFT_1062630 [Tuber borchii]|uniref:Uncharacterized protein n=1 Tax=Tuber borchii TaxID=42251 RepID=A0A2T7A185_TUBBO|nr:hypothetical protein B9Z19DRAFT_1062630 [Tuber borchii]